MYTSSVHVAIASGAMPEYSPVPLAPPCSSQWHLTLQQRVHTLVRGEGKSDREGEGEGGRDGPHTHALCIMS